MRHIAYCVLCVFFSMLIYKTEQSPPLRPSVEMQIISIIRIALILRIGAGRAIDDEHSFKKVQHIQLAQLDFVIFLC